MIIKQLSIYVILCDINIQPVYIDKENVHYITKIKATTINRLRKI